MGLLSGRFSGFQVFIHTPLHEFPLVSPVYETAEWKVSLPSVIWEIYTGSVSGKTGLSPEPAIPWQAV